MSHDLNEMVNEIVSDGVISDDEIATLQKEFGTDGISRAQMDAVFRINDGVAGNPNNSTTWPTFMADVITKGVLEDAGSPGEIDTDEVEFLVSHMQADGQIDSTELFVLNQLAEKTTLDTLPAPLEALRISSATPAS